MSKLTGVKVIDMVGGEVTKVAYNGAEYVKVDEKAQIGDLLRITKCISSCFTFGGYYEVNKVEEYQPLAVDDDGDEIFVWSEFEVFRKINANATSTIDQRVTALEHDVAELKGAKVSDDSRPLSVGDYAKVVKSEAGNEGKIVKITKVNDDGYDYIVELDGLLYGANAEKIVKATEEEVAEAKAIAKWTSIGRKPNEFKKGDIVRVTQLGAITGKHLELTERHRSCDGRYGKAWRHTHDGGWLGEEQFELIAPVESRFDVEAQ